MSDQTRELARFVAGLRYEQIPADVVESAVHCLVDQIGCQIGGTELPWAKQVRETYASIGGKPEATVVGYGDKLPLVSAAFINSTFGHSIEFDDGNTLTRGHPSAELIGSLVATVEREHASGRDFLTAFLAAYEIRGRIGWAASEDMSEHGGPHDSTTCGPFGTAAAVSKLFGMDVEGIHNAIGIAGAYSGGLMQYDHSGGSVKRIYAAIAGTSGIQSALLARAGMTGPQGILEGKRGLLKIYSPSRHQPERLTADLGKKWMLEHVRFKPYCSCGAIHAAIDGLRDIATNKVLKADDIESIEVGYAKHNYEHVAIPNPYDLTGMQFSTQYSLALTMLRGGNTPREYTLDALTDPAIRAFAAKVHIREDDELSKIKGRFPARVKVQTRRGETHENVVLDPTGSAGAPLSPSQIDDKFRSQVAPALGKERCERLLQTLRNVVALDDMAKLMPALVFDPPRNGSTNAQATATGVSKAAST